MILNGDITQGTTQNDMWNIKDVLDFIGNIDTIKGIVSFVILVCLFVFLLLTFRKKVNKITNKQIEFFISDGKYIPQIYIEISQAMEYLRYFIQGNKWKKRIIRYYNTIFKGHDGKAVLQFWGTNIKSKLFVFQKSKTIKSNISKTIYNFENIRTEKNEVAEKDIEAIFYMQNLIYHRTYALKQCERLIDLITAKNLIVVGSAGNGKTNLFRWFDVEKIDYDTVLEIFGEKTARKYEELTQKGFYTYLGHINSDDSCLTSFMTTDRFEIDNKDFYMNGLNCAW